MSYDVLWCGAIDDKLYKMDGFSSTLTDSQDVSGIDNSPQGISWDGTDTLWGGVQAVKLYKIDGFSSTLTDSQDVSGIDNPSGITWDGTDTLWSGLTDDKLYKMDGFSSTLTDSQDVSGISTSPSGISWDSTHTLWCGLTDRKLYKMDEFTSTLQNSEDVSGIDTWPMGITWDGTNVLWCGSTDDKLYLMDEFSSTLTDSQDISGIDTYPDGISINNLSIRIGQIILSSFVLTSSLDNDIDISLDIELTGTTSLDLDIYAGATIECSDFEAQSSLDTDIDLSLDVILSGTVSLAVSPTIEVPCSTFSATELLSLEYDYFTLIDAHKVYIFTLTGDADGTTDINIPISSFQTRVKSGDPSYLSVTIPGIDYLSSINARLNGELVLRMGYKRDGTILLTEIVSAVDFSNPPDYDEGSTNESITLSGYRTETYITKSVTISGNIYKSMRNGKLRFRCNPDLYLRPGDTVSDGVDSFTVDSITFSVSSNSETYEVAE